jgi:hypothetical protein
MLASNWQVPPEFMPGLRSQPRLGAATFVDLFVDMPQPLTCLTVRTWPNRPESCLLGGTGWPLAGVSPCTDCLHVPFVARCGCAWLCGAGSPL